jgi:predicted transcriptional regulator
MEMFSDKFRIEFQVEDELVEKIKELAEKKDFSELNEIRRYLKKNLELVERRMDELVR